jgi:ABC-type polysaccharide/polyol phosphate export permease
MFQQAKALWQRRELLKYLVVSDLKLLYRNKALGFLWSILDPLFLMLVYTLLVVVIFRRGGPQFPVLLFSALLAWRWFIIALQSSVTSVTSRAKLIQSVNFPKSILPLIKVTTGLVSYLIGLVILVPMLFIFEADFTFNILWLPVLIFIQLLFVIGAAYFGALLGVYFRDLQNILQFLLRIWFYLSPALYTVADRIPEKYQGIYMLNPFAALFTSYKNILVLGLPPSEYMLLAAAIAVVVLIAGFGLFTRQERQFAKVI